MSDRSCPVNHKSEKSFTGSDTDLGATSTANETTATSSIDQLVMTFEDESYFGMESAPVTGQCLKAMDLDLVPKTVSDSESHPIAGAATSSCEPSKIADPAQGQDELITDEAIYNEGILLEDLGGPVSRADTLKISQMMEGPDFTSRSARVRASVTRAFDSSWVQLRRRAYTVCLSASNLDVCVSGALVLILLLITITTGGLFLYDTFRIQKNHPGSKSIQTYHQLNSTSPSVQILGENATMNISSNSTLEISTVDLQLDNSSAPIDLLGDNSTMSFPTNSTTEEVPTVYLQLNNSSPSLSLFGENGQTSFPTNSSTQEILAENPESNIIPLFVTRRRANDSSISTSSKKENITRHKRFNAANDERKEPVRWSPKTLRDGILGLSQRLGLGQRLRAAVQLAPRAKAYAKGLLRNITQWANRTSALAHGPEPALDVTLDD